MINPSFQTNPPSIRGEDSFILTNLNLPDDKRPSKIKPTPFCSHQKKSHWSRQNHLVNSSGEKETQVMKTKSKGAKKGHIPILKKNWKKEENDKIKVRRQSHKRE
jgi:hypothetical protein